MNHILACLGVTICFSFAHTLQVNDIKGSLLTQMPTKKHTLLKPKLTEIAAGLHLN